MSYSFTSSYNFDPTRHVSLYRVNPDTNQLMVVKNRPENLEPCTLMAQKSQDIDQYSMQMDNPAQSQFCYGFAETMSFVVLSQNNVLQGDDITAINHTLNFLLW